MNNQEHIRKLRTMPYEEYLKTPEWQKKRELALGRDGHRCRACNTEEKLQVHHRTYERRGNEDLNDLTTFCESCHEHFHKKLSQTEIMGRTYEAPFVPVSKEAQAQKLEDYLIGLLIQHPDLCLYVNGILSEGDFIGPDTLALYRLLCTAPPGVPFEQLVPSDLKFAASRVVSIISEKTSLLNIEYQYQAKDVLELATRIKRAGILRASEELQVLMLEAAKVGDRDTERQLRQRIFENQKLIHTLGRP